MAHRRESEVSSTMVEGSLKMPVVPKALRAPRTDQSSMDFVKKIKLLEYLMYLSMYVGDLDNWQKSWD